MKVLSNFELLLWFTCNQMDIKVVISIKCGWNTIVWMKIRHPKDFAQNLLVAKYQNFVDTLGSQKPMWTTFLEFEFFLSKKTRLQILPG